jgi:hypothetical protein
LGCGRNGKDTVAGQGGQNAVHAQSETHTNHLTVTTDEYGLQKPDFYYTTDNASFWTIQADIARDLWDNDFACVIRIDISKMGGSMPALNKIFALEEAHPQHEKFPGTFFVFNGQKSVQKKVEQGIISFTPDSTEYGDINGTFDVIMTDYDSTILPPPQYRLSGSFSFRMGTSGPANPRPDEVYPMTGKESYDRFCSSCHSLGDFDMIGESASDLSMRGGELPLIFPGAVPKHQEIPLGSPELQSLRIFLNAW